MGTIVEQGSILEPLQLLVGDGKNAKYVKGDLLLL